MLQSISQVARALVVPCEESLFIHNFQIDSRLVTPGSLFFALKGAKTDGHHFLREARANGAVAAVVERGYAGDAYGMVLLPVFSVFNSLQALARHQLQESAIRVIGVTGSVGKTTTKELIFSLLQGSFRVGKTPNNYNTQLTVPLSILNREGSEEVLVLEMGMSEPGEIGKLVAIAPPEVAVLTQVALAHTASFSGGIHEIAKNKGEIFSSPVLKCPIYPEELSRFQEHFSGVCREKKVTFSVERKEADYFLSTQGIDAQGVRIAPFFVPFSERHLRHNLCAAIAVARYMGVEWEAICHRMGQLQLPKMRMETWEREGIIYINDAYNANPESMRAAFESVAAKNVKGKKIAVLGEMASLGAFSEECHREIGWLAGEIFDCLFAIGPAVGPLVKSFHQKSQKPVELFFDHMALANRLKMVAEPGDLVLIKGSRSMALERIIPCLMG